jgi:hypothetical protein
VRQKRRILLTAWVFLPQPAAAGHAIIYLPPPFTHPLVFSALKEARSAGNATKPKNCPLVEHFIQPMPHSKRGV